MYYDLDLNNPPPPPQTVCRHHDGVRVTKSRLTSLIYTGFQPTSSNLIPSDETAYSLIRSPLNDDGCSSTSMTFAPSHAKSAPKPARVRCANGTAILHSSVMCRAKPQSMLPKKLTADVAQTMTSVDVLLGHALRLNDSTSHLGFASTDHDVHSVGRAR